MFVIQKYVPGMQKPPVDFKYNNNITNNITVRPYYLIEYIDEISP